MYLLVNEHFQKYKIKQMEDKAIVILIRGRVQFEPSPLPSLY